MGVVRKHGVGELAYCLMTNHTHLMLTSAQEESLNLAIEWPHFLFTQYINLQGVNSTQNGLIPCGP